MDSVNIHWDFRKPLPCSPILLPAPGTQRGFGISVQQLPDSCWLLEIGTLEWGEALLPSQPSLPRPLPALTLQLMTAQQSTAAGFPLFPTDGAGSGAGEVALGLLSPSCSSSASEPPRADQTQHSCRERRKAHGQGGGAASRTNPSPKAAASPGVSRAQPEAQEAGRSHRSHALQGGNGYRCGMPSSHFPGC